MSSPRVSGDLRVGGDAGRSSGPVGRRGGPDATAADKDAMAEDWRGFLGAVQQ